MRAILSRAGRQALEGMLARRTLLAFDFDGTLAPLVDDPRAALLPARTRRLLIRLARRLPCIVISGRARADLVPRFAGIPLRRLSGNHGADVVPESGSHRRVVRGWRDAIQHRLRGVAGVWVEDKGLSLCVHVRPPASLRSLRAALRTLQPSLPRARQIPGKRTVNLVMDNAVNKGTALARALRELRCDAALFVGDDVTDEDVFTALPEPRLIGVRVGHSRASHARWYLRGQREIDELLAELARRLGSRARPTSGKSVRPARRRART